MSILELKGQTEQNVKEVKYDLFLKESRKMEKHNYKKYIKNILFLTRPLPFSFCYLVPEKNLITFHSIKIIAICRLNLKNTSYAISCAHSFTMIFISNF